MNKLSPDRVKWTVEALEAVRSSIQKSIDEVKSRCSHEGCVNFYPDTYDSVWMCEACGRFWNRKPEGV